MSEREAAIDWDGDGCIACQRLLHALVGGLLALSLGAIAAPVQAATQPADSLAAASARTPGRSFLPFLADEARKRGIELPLPFGAGLVYYHLDREIRITDVKVGRNGAPPSSVSEFAQLGSWARVDNVNVKVDAWLLPFVNLYAIAGYLQNESDTRIEVGLPPLVPGGTPRTRETTVPTQMNGTVYGAGMTLAGGYGPFFMTFDVNLAQADLGFDEAFHAVVSSARGGWNGVAGGRPLRAWASVTDWNTFAEARGTVPDPDGGTLAFVVEQGPAHRATYGLGAMYSWPSWCEIAFDGGADFHGGWYIAVIPVVRF